MKEYMDAIGVISLILAVLAMIVALWHVYSIHATARRLDDVQRSLSTRYIGQFPEFFQDIVSLIKTAKHEIVIFCDSPAYTCFSDHLTFLEYKHELERKAQEEEMTITFTCSGPEYRSRTAIKQFLASPLGWDERKTEPVFNKRLKYFLSSHRGAPAIDGLTAHQFLELIADTEKRTLEDTFAQAHVREIEVYIPLHFWLVDNIKAVFAIPEGTVEYGFSTTDQKLISALVVMRDQYHGGSGASSGPEAQLLGIRN
jgi:hypothetical protein